MDRRARYLPSQRPPLWRELNPFRLPARRVSRVEKCSGPAADVKPSASWRESSYRLHIGVKLSMPDALAMTVARRVDANKVTRLHLGHPGIEVRHRGNVVQATLSAPA